MRLVVHLREWKIEYSIIRFDSPGTDQFMNKILVYKNHEKYQFNKIFQIRWKEALGNKEFPYLYRWTIILFGYSIRLHHWIYSDDDRFFHDHSCNFISIVLWGWYYNIIPIDDKVLDVNKCKRIKVKAGNFWISKALSKHYLEIPPNGAWTLLLQGRPYHKWGFYVNNKKWRPRRYFNKFGIIQDSVYYYKYLSRFKDNLSE